MENETDSPPETEIVQRTRSERRDDAALGCCFLAAAGLLIWSLFSEPAELLTAILWTTGALIVGAFFIYRATRPTKKQLTHHGEVHRARRREEFRNKWWVRYPVGVALLTAIWWIASQPDFSFENDTAAFMVIVGMFAAGIYALWLTREVSKYLLLLAGVLFAWNWLSDLSDDLNNLPPGRAIIVGACIIAAAIFYVGGSRRN